jgi:pyruvate carboxylase subunit B
MKYYVKVNNEAHEVELVERSGRIELSYDGKAVDARYEEVDRLGQVSLFLGETCYAVSLEGNSENVLVTVAGRLYEVEIEDERERAAHQAERSRGQSSGDVKSVMPGVVVELLVSEGESVEQGQPLLILEAMKMQNEIGAPASGVVKRVHVKKGQAVAGGAKLLSLST